MAPSFVGYHPTRAQDLFLPKAYSVLRDSAAAVARTLAVPPDKLITYLVRNWWRCPAEVLCRRAVAVRRPAGRPEQVSGDFARAARAPKVAQDLDPVEERDAQRVVAAQRAHEAVATRHGCLLRDVRAEQPVEDHQHAAIVGVEILEVRGVMHAVR